MDIVLFGNSAWCIYNFRLNLIKELLRYKHRVFVISPCDSSFDDRIFQEKLKELSAVVCSLPMKPRSLNPLFELYAVVSLFLLLRKIKPDVLLSFTVKCNLYAGLCRRFLRFRQIANVPGLGEAFEKKSLVQQIVRVMYRICLGGVQVALFQNRQDLEYCLRRNLIKDHQSGLLPGSGVDLKKFSFSPPPRNAEVRTFLMFGRLLPQKGYYVFLEAAERLQLLTGISIRCWILGIEDKNRQDSRKLLEAVRQAESKGFVRYFSPRPDVLPVLQDADIVVLPSWYNEGVPRSVLEAMACGKPVITTDWKGCRETVENGVNGLLVPIKNAIALMEAMKKLASMDVEKLHEMGKMSRKLVRKRFDEQTVIGRYLAEIQGEVVPLPLQATRTRKSVAGSVPYLGQTVVNDIYLNTER